MKKVLAGCVMLVMMGMVHVNAYAVDGPVIGMGKKVTLDYTLTVDNKQIETSVGKTPLSYTAGTHSIIPRLEAQLNGMHVGEEKVIAIIAKEAYGLVDSKRLREFAKTDLPKNLELKVGVVLQANAADGSKFPVKISAIKGDKVVIDFNHPLAGKDLTFKVKILKIETV